MKNLPRVFATPIEKEIYNNTDIFYSGNNNRSFRTQNVQKEINDIFSSSNHVYKSRVFIKTTNDDFETVIVGKTNQHLLTLDGGRILIQDIRYIEKI